MRQVARKGTGGAALGQREDGGTIGLFAGEGIGMDGDEKVCLHLARLLHTAVERQEEVTITRQHRTHIGFAVDLRFQLLGDGERDVLLPAASGANRARVFTTMAGIEHDRDHATG